MPKKPTRSRKPSKAPSHERGLTIHEKLTNFFVLLEWVKGKLEMLSNQLETANLDSKKQEAFIQESIGRLNAVDLATADSVKRLSIQQEEIHNKILNADTTNRLTKHEAQIATFLTKTQEIESIKTSNNRLWVYIRIQWVVLSLTLIFAAYLYGAYRPSQIP